MPKVLIRRVVRRNPVRIMRLPALVRFSLYAGEQRNRAARRILIKLTKTLIGTAHHRLGIRADGRMRLERPDAVAVELAFDAGNSHYGHLYRGGVHQEYEPKISALIDTLIPGARVFHDVGANWGYFALLAATQSAFRGAVHAFEPVSETFCDMQRLVEQTGMGDRITPHHTALSDQNGVMAMKREFHSALARLDRNAGGPEVPVARLDDLDVPPPDVMKIDVEGHEAKVLEGGRRKIAERTPMIVFESLQQPGDPSSALAPFKILSALEYWFFRPMWRLGEGGASYLGDDDSAVSGLETADLALLPFPPGHRLAFGVDMNVLAVHRNRMDELMALFRETEI